LLADKLWLISQTREQDEEFRLSCVRFRGRKRGQERRELFSGKKIKRDKKIVFFK